MSKQAVILMRPDYISSVILCMIIVCLKHESLSVYVSMKLQLIPILANNQPIYKFQLQKHVYSSYSVR